MQTAGECWLERRKAILVGCTASVLGAEAETNCRKEDSKEGHRKPGLWKRQERPDPLAHEMRGTEGGKQAPSRIEARLFLRMLEPLGTDNAIVIRKWCCGYEVTVVYCRNSKCINMV